MPIVSPTASDATTGTGHVEPAVRWPPRVPDRHTANLSD
jgi:hypothetical protein